MKYIFFCLLLVSCLLACKKFLDQKPDIKLVVPQTIADVQALMDNVDRMNHVSPWLAETSADNYYLDYTDWNALTDLLSKGAYSWQDFDNTSLANWNYATINACNTALETLEKINPAAAQQTQYNDVKGQALFFRAYTYFQMAEVYCLPYGTNAAIDLGLSLKLSASLDEPTVRSTVQQTYDLIIGDLQQASQLLPATQLFKTRPTNAAAFAALARVYLAMEKYSEAKLAADSCLNLYNTLIDYNTLSITATLPFTRFNAEVIFHSRTNGGSALAPSRAKVDSNLYTSYNTNDLRKALYFRSNGNNTYQFKGNYDGTSSSSLFTGLATDEVWLIKAEAEARLGNTVAAMQALNTLMSKRWKSGTFVPFTAPTANAALSTILVERRKELVFRHLRWSDLRRLNKDPQLATTPKRILNGITYELPPNSLRYVHLLPTAVVNASGIPQNPR